MTSMTAASFSETRGKLQTIGASDSPAVLGVSPFANALSVYMQKVQGVQVKVNRAMEMGKILEDTIARLYEKQTGHTLKGDGETIHQSPFWPWMHATPDRWRDDGLLVEVKNVREETGWGAEWTDDIPIYYKVQGQHQMGVLNCEKMDFAVLIGGCDFRIYCLERDHDFVSRMVQILKDFYEQHILKDVAPAMDFQHRATLDTLRRLETFDPRLSVIFTDESDRYLEKYLDLCKAEKEVVIAKDEVKAKILALMGDAATAAGAAGRIARRKVVNRKEYTVNASTYVRLDVHQKERKA